MIRRYREAEDLDLCYISPHTSGWGRRDSYHTILRAAVRRRACMEFTRRMESGVEDDASFYLVARVSAIESIRTSRLETST